MGVACGQEKSPPPVGSATSEPPPTMPGASRTKSIRIMCFLMQRKRRAEFALELHMAKLSQKAVAAKARKKAVKRGGHERRRCRLC